jgi:hypothetical protein
MWKSHESLSYPYVAWLHTVKFSQMSANSFGNNILNSIQIESIQLPGKRLYVEAVGKSSGNLADGMMQMQSKF